MEVPIAPLGELESTSCGKNPGCADACPANAIVFGDVSKPDSAVTARKEDGRDYDLLTEANTRPRTTYQARIRKGERS